MRITQCLFFFFLNDPAPPEISPLPLPAALPISPTSLFARPDVRGRIAAELVDAVAARRTVDPTAAFDELLLDVRPFRGDEHLVIALYRSEEHTSELQSQSNLVCRLLLEKKKKKP